MKTQVFSPSQLNIAAELLKQGALVAFPTETVFGLGAVANNSQAIQRVFEVKGRPADNPLIVHVASIDSVKNYVTEINAVSQRLMEAFWPGPLTIIFPTNADKISPLATNYQNTVGLRMPRQLETLLLIEMVGFPLVGPSANLSTKPSPTHVDHVLHDLSGKIAGVVANQQPLTEIGVESTVVYPSQDQITILRPGAITAEMIKEVIDIPVIEKTADQQLASQEIMSPGVKYTHYSPSQPVYIVKASHSIQEWKDILNKEACKIGLLADQDHVDSLKDYVDFTYCLGPAGDVSQATRNLFAGLRFLELTDCQVIFAQGFEEANLSHAYMNRLTKASKLMI